MSVDRESPLSNWEPLPFPRSLSSFVGRRQEVEDVLDLLNGGAPLVTLVGPGGVGKTRLALRIAEAIAVSTGGRFADGIAFVRLDAIQDAALVASQVVRGLGLQEQANRSAEQVLAEHLARQCLLLILDNFEHLLDAAILVHDLLTSSSGLAVLATSRVPLNLTGEQLSPVDPLTLPAVPEAVGGEDGSVAPADVAAVAAADAGRLFLDRARARNPRFLLTPANARTVARLCARLDGLPLAIELAAARLRTSGPGGLLRLESLLPSLDEGPRDAPARQLTVRDTLAWSYDRLPADHQRVFRSLGVFVGGFTLEAATAVVAAGIETAEENAGRWPESDLLAATGQLAILDDLRALADQSLVAVDLAAGDDGRYSLLETTREFALELLIAHDELETARVAEVRYFTTWLEQAETGLTGRDHERWGRRLDADLPNVRVVLDWALAANGDLLEAGLRMTVALWPFWERRGYRQEAERWLRRARARSGEAESALKVKVLRRLGNALYDTQPNEADETYEEGLALSRRLGLAPLTAALLRNLATSAVGHGNYDAAAAYLSDALKVFRSQSDDLGYGRTLVNLGTVLSETGRFDEAKRCVEEALGVFERMNDPESIVGAYYQFGRLCRLSGSMDDALAHLQHARRLADAAGETEWAAYCRREEAVIARGQGNGGLALELLTEAIQSLRQTGTDFGAVLCLDELAAVAVTQGQPELAATLWGSVEVWRELTGTRLAGVEQARRALDLEIGRGTLADELWASAWRRGRALGLAQAVALTPRIRVLVVHTAPVVAPATRSEGVRLTMREIEVLRLVAENLTDKEIGERLSISRRTVTTHMENIFTKLDVRGRVEAAVFASRHGLLLRGNADRDNLRQP